MTGPIPYAAELAPISAQQLAAWDQHPQDGSTLPVLTGPCPICGDDCEAPLTDMVVTGGTAAAADTTPVPATTRLITCNCAVNHGQPAGVRGGCGRYWLVTLIRQDGGGYALAPETDLSLLAPNRALDEAVASQNSRVQGAAEKWLGAVTALYGLFSLTGIATANDALAGIGTGAKILIACVLLLGLAAAGAALFLGYRAAYGWPVATDVTDNAALRAWYTRHRNHARVAADELRRAVVAAVASLVAVTVVMLLTWFLPRVSP